MKKRLEKRKGHPGNAANIARTRDAYFRACGYATKAQVAAAGRLNEREGEIEIDDVTTVSGVPGNPEHGAYVLAWVWVPDEELR